MAAISLIIPEELRWRCRVRELWCNFSLKIKSLMWTGES